VSLATVLVNCTIKHMTIVVSEAITINTPIIELLAFALASVVNYDHK
jgi:hypothetical protein